MEFDEFDIEYDQAYSAIDDDLHHTDRDNHEYVDSGMSNSDYNLDSPLNSYFIDGNHEYLLTKRSPVHHKVRILREVSIILQNLQIRPEVLKNSTRFHHIVGSLMMSLSEPIGNPPLGVIRILNYASSDAILADAYLVEFRKEVQGRSPTSSSTCSHIIAAGSHSSMNYLIVYIHMHILILIMNGDRNHEQLVRQSTDSDWSGVGLELTVSTLSIKVTSSNLGVFYLNGETVIWERERIILDKNMVLMIKDMYIGRFMTLNILEGSSDDVINKVKVILHAGNKLLKDNGNIAYDTIKMLEPLCVHRWLEISGRSQYDRDSAERFKQHIIRSLAEKIPDAQTFFRITSRELEDILDAKQIGSVFGSFRLWGHPFIMYKDGFSCIEDTV